MNFTLKKMKRKQNKNLKYVFIAIEVLWLLMAHFVLFAAYRIYKGNENNQWMAWMYLVIAILCFVMFFQRKAIRKRNNRKR